MNIRKKVVISVGVLGALASCYMLATLKPEEKKTVEKPKIIHSTVSSITPLSKNNETYVVVDGTYDETNKDALVKEEEMKPKSYYAVVKPVEKPEVKIRLKLPDDKAHNYKQGTKLKINNTELYSVNLKFKDGKSYNILVDGIKNKELLEKVKEYQKTKQSFPSNKLLSEEGVLPQNVNELSLKTN